MANGATKNTLRKIVEGEHLAANALAVAVGKVQQSNLQELFSQLRSEHEANAAEAGQQLLAAGGNYPEPGLRDQLKNGWELILNAKNTAEALKLLQRKELDVLGLYRGLLKKVSDEQTMSLVLRNMADVTENVVKLRETLSQEQGKKKSGGKILGIPNFLWLLGAAGGVGYAVYQQRVKSGPSNPITPGSTNS